MSRGEVFAMRAGEAETISRVPPPPRSGAAFSPYPGDVRAPRRRSGRSMVLLGVAALLVALVTFFAARAFLQGRRRADELAGQLHTRMNQKDWIGIYSDADAVYQAGTSSSDSEALFAAINRKLGQVNHTSQLTTNITVNNSGSYLTAQFQTHFAGDEHATETIVWRSLGGAYHLYAYTIQSLPLLTK